MVLLGTIGYFSVLLGTFCPSPPSPSSRCSSPARDAHLLSLELVAAQAHRLAVIARGEAHEAAVPGLAQRPRAGPHLVSHNPDCCHAAAAQRRAERRRRRSQLKAAASLLVSAPPALPRPDGRHAAVAERRRRRKGPDGFDCQRRNHGLVGVSNRCLLSRADLAVPRQPGIGCRAPSPRVRSSLAVGGWRVLELTFALLGDGLDAEDLGRDAAAFGLSFDTRLGELQLLRDEERLRPGGARSAGAGGAAGAAGVR